MKTLEELEDKLYCLTAQMNKLYEEKIFSCDYLDDSVIEKLDRLKEEYFRTIRDIEKLKKADYSDGELDLVVNEHKSNGERNVYYDIRLTDDLSYIGEIRVTYVNHDRFFGDIGYELVPKYRGNGYMLQALNILKEPLIERGLTKPILTVFPDNIASVKTIQRFGGEKIDSTGFYDIYQVDLEEESKRRK